MIYFATPYSHPDKAVQEIRFKQVTYATGVLMQCGYHVLSPITHGYPIAGAGDLPHGFEFWEELCKKQIAACRQVWILGLQGWKESTGVTSEQKIARYFGKPIRLLYWSDFV